MKRITQIIVNNKASFISVWICLSIIIGLLALTIGIIKDETPGLIWGAVYVKGFGLWLPYKIANTVSLYWEGKLGVAGFNLFSKFVEITPYYLFILTILYWIFLAFLFTIICHLPVIRISTRDPDHSETNIRP